MEPTVNRRNLLRAAGSVTLLSLGAAPSGATEGDTLAGLPDRNSPVRVSRFSIKISGVETPGWRSVTLPTSSVQAGTYRQGADSDKQVWGQTSFGNLEMTRGLAADDSLLFDWREAIRAGDVSDGRRDVTVTLLSETGEPQRRWVLSGAWITEYDPPTLDATADDVATETVALGVGEMTIERNPGQALEAQFSVGSDEIAAGEEVTLDAGESTGAIDSYEWNFGDGTTTTGETATHSYESAGEYTVELTVTGAGQSATITQQFVVGRAETLHESGVRPAVFEAVDTTDDGVLTLQEVRSAIADWQSQGQIGGVDVTEDELQQLVDWWQSEVDK